MALDLRQTLSWLPVPNDWRKTNKAAVQSKPSPRQEAYRAFFQRLIDELRERHSFTGARRAPAASYYHFSSGSTYLFYGFSFVRGNRARVELYLVRGRDENKRLFDELREAQQELESELDEPLEWERLDEAQASRIAVYRPGSIDDEESLDEIREWAIHRLLKFKEVFGPRLSEIAT